MIFVILQVEKKLKGEINPKQQYSLRKASQLLSHLDRVAEERNMVSSVRYSIYEDKTLLFRDDFLVGEGKAANLILLVNQTLNTTFKDNPEGEKNSLLEKLSAAMSNDVVEDFVESEAIPKKISLSQSFDKVKGYFLEKKQLKAESRLAQEKELQLRKSEEKSKRLAEEQRQLAEQERLLERQQIHRNEEHGYEKPIEAPQHLYHIGAEVNNSDEERDTSEEKIKFIQKEEITPVPEAKVVNQLEQPERTLLAKKKLSDFKWPFNFKKFRAVKRVLQTSENTSATLQEDYHSKQLLEKAKLEFFEELRQEKKEHENYMKLKLKEKQKEIASFEKKEKLLRRELRRMSAPKFKSGTFFGFLTKTVVVVAVIMVGIYIFDTYLVEDSSTSALKDVLGQMGSWLEELKKWVS